MPFEANNNNGPVMIFDKEETVSEIDSLRREADEIIAQINSLKGVAEEVGKPQQVLERSEIIGLVESNHEADTVNEAMQDEVSVLGVRLKGVMLKLTERGTRAKVNGLSVPEVDEKIQKIRSVLDELN